MARAHDIKEYYRGYHAAQRAFYEGGAAYARVVLEDKKRGGVTDSYKAGYKLILKKRKRDYEYSGDQLLTHYA